MFSFIDFIITPAYYIITIIIAFLYTKFYLKGLKNIKVYFWWGLILKILAGQFMLIVFTQIIPGDMLLYRKCTTFLYELLFQDPILLINFITQPKYELQAALFEYYNIANPDWQLPANHSPSSFQNHNFIHNIRSKGLISYFLAKDTSVVINTALIASIISFNSSFSIGLFFSLINFAGSWILFMFFYKNFSLKIGWLAVALLFLPSVVLWGSAPFMKEPIVTIALAITISSFYKIFYSRSKLLNLIFFTFSIYLLYIVKAYIAFIIFPSLVIWILLKKKKQLKTYSLRILSTPIFLFLIVIFSSLSLAFMSRYSERFSIDNILSYLQAFRDYSVHRSELYGGTTYHVGDFDGSIISLLVTIPNSVITSLYKPFPWEVSKLILLPSSLEGLFLLILSSYLIIKIRPIRLIKKVYNSPDLIFLFCFSITLLFFVGFATLNYGSLIRYKIQGISFFIIGISILLTKQENNIN